MIRFAAALLIAAVLLGSVAWCQNLLTQGIEVRLTRDVHAEETEPEEGNAEAEYELVLTPGFDAASDPFALDVSEKTARLLVREGDKELLRYEQDVRRGQSIRRADIRFGGNPVDLFVEAVPTPDDAANPCALRVQVMRGKTLMAETTLWSAGGGSVISAPVRLKLEPHRERLDRGLGRDAS